MEECPSFHGLKTNLVKKVSLFAVEIIYIFGTDSLQRRWLAMSRAQFLEVQREQSRNLTLPP